MDNPQIIPDSSISVPQGVDVNDVRNNGATFPAGPSAVVTVDLTPTTPLEVEVGSVTVDVTNVASITVTPIDSSGADKPGDEVTVVSISSLLEYFSLIFV